MKINSFIIIFYLQLIIFLLSCAHYNEQNAVGASSISPVDTLCLQLGHSGSIASKTMLYHEEHSGKYLAIWNEGRQNIIQFYNLNDGTLAHTVSIKSVGPDGTPMFNGFAIKNLDSIYLAGMDNRLHLINKEGTVLSRISYDNILGHIVYIPVLSFSRYNTQMLIHGDRLWAQNPDNITNYQTNTGPDRHKLFYEIDLNTGKAIIENFTFPTDFWRDGTKELSYAWAYDGNRIVIAPQFSHDIYVVDGKDKLIRQGGVPSDYVKYLRNYKENEVANMTQEQYGRFLLQHPKYIGLLYDAWRNIYYRLFYPGTHNFPPEATIMDATTHLPQIGVLVLDAAFNKKGEWLLPAHTYTQTGAFVNKDGLFIPANHPDNAQVNENEICFHLFQLWQ